MARWHRQRIDRRRTLSKPAMFLFSAKNSAGLLCSRVSAFTAFLPMPAALHQRCITAGYIGVTAMPMSTTVVRLPHAECGPYCP